MNIRQKYSDVIIFAAILVVVMAIMGYVIMVQINNMTDTNNEAEAMSLQVSQANLKFNSLLKIKSELPIYERQLAEFNAFIPDSLSETSIIEYVQNSLIKSNSDITSIKFETSVSANGYVEKNINLTVYSEYEGLLTFLNNLQNGERLVLINSVDITKDKDKSTGIVSQISVKMFSMN